jgi:P-type conjugative transfer protein TrbL
MIAGTAANDNVAPGHWAPPLRGPGGEATIAADAAAILAHRLAMRVRWVRAAVLTLCLCLFIPALASSQAALESQINAAGATGVDPTTLATPADQTAAAASAPSTIPSAGALAMSVDAIVTTFERALTGVSVHLSIVARNIMGTLIIFELVWAFGQMVATGSDLGSMLYALLKRIIIVGFYFWATSAIPSNGGLDDFVAKTAAYLTQTAAGGGAPITAGSFLKAGIAQGMALVVAAGWSFQVFIAAFAAVFIVICCAAIGAALIVTYVEIHFLFSLAIVALGFGAWTQTEQFARNYLMGAVGKTFKLFGILMVGNVFTQIFNTVGLGAAGATVNNPAESGLLLAGITFVMVVIAFVLPSALEHLVTGGSISPTGGGALGGAVGGFAGSMMGGAAKLAGGGAAKLGGMGFGPAFGPGGGNSGGGGQGGGGAFSSGRALGAKMSGRAAMAGVNAVAKKSKGTDS